MLLKQWNALVLPILPMVDLRRDPACAEHLAHHLCTQKGRLFPDTKSQMIQLALQLTAGSEGQPIPKVNLHVPLPESKAAALSGSGASVFVQLFEQLHGKHDLIASAGRTEVQLWRVHMTGEGASVLWTDGQDAGGMYRASISKLCDELQSTSA
eukprot:COSAG01_NODE_30430_length_616_cov_0.903288_1_plen_153_part_10